VQLTFCASRAIITYSHRFGPLERALYCCAPGQGSGIRRMNVLDFEKLVRSEKTAKHYMLTRCSMVADIRCPSCSSDRLYEVESGKRRRCPQCGHTFNPFAGRYLNNVKLSANEWLWVVKLFELETSATVIADEIGISYPTALKTIDTIRRAIAETPCSGDNEPGGCKTADSCRMLGAPNGNGASGEMEPMADDTILHHLRLGDDCLIMTDKTPEFGYLVCRERKIEVVDHGRSFPKLRVYCSAKGFWTFAKERFVKYHGISSDKLPGYLEEMRFRWLNRGTPLFDLILERLCRYAPTDTSWKRERAAQYVA
jgi:transposase